MEVFGSYMRQKHQKPKRGFKTNSKSYLNQVPILGDKGMIYTTPNSNGNYYFRTWIAEEAKYYRVGLRTKVQEDAIKSGEDEMLDILNKLKQGHKIFGMSWGGIYVIFSWNIPKIGLIRIGSPKEDILLSKRKLTGG